MPKESVSLTGRAGWGVLLCATAVIPLGADSARAALERGLRLLGEEKFEQALDALERAARELPEHAQIQNLLGITLTQLNRISEANQRYRRAIQLNPKLADAHKNLAFNCWKAGDAAAAEKSFRSALALEPGDEFAHYGLGSVLLALGRELEAMGHLSKAYSLVRRDPPVLLNLAAAYIRTGQFARAVDLLKDLTVDANIASLLGAAYEGLGNLPGALENYEQAVRLDPTNHDRYLDYTRLLLDLNRFEDAVEVVQEGLRTAQDRYALHLRLGATELMRGNAEKAETAFREAIAMHPDVPLGYVALAKAFMKTGRNTEAAALLREARRRLGPDFLLEYFYGLAAGASGEDSAALEAFSQASRLNPEVPDAHFQIGKLLLKAGRISGAKSALERAIELNPRHAAAYFQLSRVYAKMGDQANAKRFAARAMELRTQAQATPTSTSRP